MNEHYFIGTVFRCAFAHTGGHRAFCRDTRVLFVVEGRFLGYEKVGEPRLIAVRPGSEAAAKGLTAELVDGEYRSLGYSCGYSWPGEDLLLAAGWERVDGDHGDLPVVAVVRGMKGVSFGGPSYYRRADAVYDSVENALAATDPVFAAQLGCWVSNERGGKWWNPGGGPYMVGSWDEVIPPS